jgi:hypothetical protein
MVMHAYGFGGSKLTWASLSSKLIQKFLRTKQKKLKCNAKSAKHTILRRMANHRDGCSGHDVYSKRIIVARTSVAILHN